MSKQSEITAAAAETDIDTVIVPQNILKQTDVKCRALKW